MSAIARLLTLSLLIIFISACQRASEGNSTVSLNLSGNYSAHSHSNMSAMSCTNCLKAVFVNVDADDMKKIVFDQKHDDFSQAGTEISPIVTLDVPAGSKRRFQVMALYLQSSKHYIQYGTVTVDLTTVEPPAIVLALQNLGEFKGGQITGRYITSFNAVTSKDVGPTGVVNVSIVHAASGAELQFAKEDIVKGWFSFFASENFLMKYVMADGTVLFGGPVNLASFSTSNNIARLFRSNNYFVSKGGSWGAGFADFNSEYHDIVYGYFGSAALTSSKKVCFKGINTPLDFNKLAQDVNGTTKLNYSTQSAANVYPVGGLNSFANSADCTSTEVNTSNRYTADKIFVSMTQLDGNGNDTARGIEGAFTYVSTSASGDISKSTLSASGDITMKSVPDVLGNGLLDIFDSVRVFKKLGATNGGADNIRCNPESLSAAGYSEVIGMNKSTISDSVTFSTAGLITTSDGIFVCPVKNSLLLGVGGIYLGSVGYASLSANSSIAFSGPSQQVATITNIGNMSASISPSLTSTNSNFVYAGGSYPGATGTCGSILAPGQSCTIQLAFSGATDNGHLIINYQSNGSTASSTDTSLSGTP